jgi:hypothetical protein
MMPNEQPSASNQAHVKDDCKDDDRSLAKLLTAQKLLHETERASGWANALGGVLPSGDTAAAKKAVRVNPAQACVNPSQACVNPS